MKNEIKTKDTREGQGYLELWKALANTVSGIVSIVSYIMRGTVSRASGIAREGRYN
jgi:hypothetical protein